MLILGLMMCMSACYRKPICDCVQRTGCSTLLAIQIANDSVIATGMACADSSVNVDSSYMKEVRAFGDKYYKDNSVRIETIDTNLKYERVKDLKKSQTKDYLARGYRCECAA
jgi:hypothetical protein